MHYTKYCRIGKCPDKLHIIFKKQEFNLLKFEHIVQVNAHGKPEIRNLTRNQLWQGLVYRAKFPNKFNPSLKCTFQEQKENEFIRTLEASNVSFYEKVILYPEKRIKTFTVAEIDQLHTESNTSIEEPSADSLFVRFQYKREIEESRELDITEYLKTAYLQLDIEAIAMIRIMAEKEYLPPIN